MSHTKALCKQSHVTYMLQGLSKHAYGRAYLISFLLCNFLCGVPSSLSCINAACAPGKVIQLTVAKQRQQYLQYRAAIVMTLYLLCNVHWSSI